MCVCVFCACVCVFVRVCVCVCVCESCMARLIIETNYYIYPICLVTVHIHTGDVGNYIRGRASMAQ